MKELKSKIGMNRGALRLWLEGKSLLEMGWKRGDRYNAIFSNVGLIYDKAEDGARAVAGTEARPIIDTNSKKLSAFAKEGEMITVKITDNQIIVNI